MSNKNDYSGLNDCEMKRLGDGLDLIRLAYHLTTPQMLVVTTAIDDVVKKNKWGVYNARFDTEKRLPIKD